MPYSKRLHLNYEVKKGWIRTEDNVVYNPAEVEKISKIDDLTAWKVHKIKKIFKGVMV